MASRSRAGEACRFCGRRTALTFHHLIPRKLHRRPRFRRRYARDALQAGILVCSSCHRAVHRRFSEMELGVEYNTAEKLAADPELARHFAWAARQRRR